MPLNASAIYPASDPEFVAFPSRRSVVHSANGVVACTQPLAAQAGLRILQEGGNAADAAVAVAAGLNMTEPASTGIGGDMFAMFYSAESKKVQALNGSGRAASDVTLAKIREDLGLKDGEAGSIPMDNVHAVTVPGAAAGWVDVVEKFGNKVLSLKQILAPAIELGEEGFPVSELSATFWSGGEGMLRAQSPETFADLLKAVDGGVRAPRPGELFKNPKLADTFRQLALEKKKGFYEGRIADSVVKAVAERGGYLKLNDLKDHAQKGSEFIETPISLKFNGQNVHTSLGHDQDSTVEVWECPPNGQGIVALMALGILEEAERVGKIPKFKKEDHNNAQYLHAVIESLRIAFADARWWVTDPDTADIPTSKMLSKEYLRERTKLFDPEKQRDHIQHGWPVDNRSDTVYFAVTDRWGNGMSFINSNFGGFGSGIIPADCGFTLHDRGASFSLQEDHPNVIAPGKRPYHTIIPAIITNPSDRSLNTVYGVMGGFMQPQGHVQVLLNMLAFNYNPQSALDAPRICIGAGMPNQGEVMSRKVYLEEGIDDAVAKTLTDMGHDVEIVTGYGRGLFGRGQVIRAHAEDGRTIYSAGSDPRGDGAAVAL